MEETLATRKMAESDLINNLEKISSTIPNRILRIDGYILKGNHKEPLEIVIFKGFSSSTTHPIETDLEKKVLKLSYILTNFKLYRAPLIETEDNSLIIEDNPLGKIQIIKANGQKCDRCWHYQKEIFNGIQNTKLCKRCSNIINLESS